ERQVVQWPPVPCLALIVFTQCPAFPLAMGPSKFPGLVPCPSSRIGSCPAIPNSTAPRRRSLIKCEIFHSSCQPRLKETDARKACLVSIHALLARTSWTYPSSPRRFIKRREQASQQATFFPRIAGSPKTHSSSHVEKLRREAFPDPAK